MAAADGDDSLYPIAVLIDELRNEDVQVMSLHSGDSPASWGGEALLLRCRNKAEAKAKAKAEAKAEASQSAK